MLADYLIVRKRTLKVEDLYVGDSRSIYWYHYGLHWRAALAWVLGTWPTFPGFVMLLRNPLDTNQWANLFKIAFLVGQSDNLRPSVPTARAHALIAQVSLFLLYLSFSSAKYHRLHILERV